MNILSHPLGLMKVERIPSRHIQVNVVVNGIEAVFDDWVPGLAHRCVPAAPIMVVSLWLLFRGGLPKPVNHC